MIFKNFGLSEDPDKSPKLDAFLSICGDIDLNVREKCFKNFTYK